MRKLRVIAIVVLAAITFYSHSSASSSVGTLLRAPTSSSPVSESVLHSAFMAGEAVSTFAADCETSNTSFNLGQTVCAKVTGAPAGSPSVRRLTWVHPANLGERSIDITSDPQTDSFTLPATTTSIVGGQVVDNRGTWRVIVTSIIDGTLEAEASITVRDQSAAAVDLAASTFGSIEVSPDSDITFSILLVNNGPDTAQAVQITDAVPANTIFVSEAQDSGPAFSCSNPSAGGTGTTTCTIASLASGETARFTLVYHVNPGTPGGTPISNTVTVSSSTSEIHDADNTFQATSTVRSVAPPQCTITCPQDISVDNDPNAANPCAVNVNYSTPSASGNCADPETGQTPPVVCSPPPNSAFPIGATTVTCSSGGNACSFQVTVHETRAPSTPAITCPGNVSANEEFPGAGAANVTYATPGATGNCAIVVCDPPSGFRFSVGTTTVTCTATDSSNNTATCSFTVTVSNGNCTVTCPGDVTQTAGTGQCSAVVTYPAPTTNGTCGTVTCNPASGATFPAGTTIVNCTSSEGPTCSFSVTVNPPTPPTITTCAASRTIAVNANCEAVIPNLVGEVQATGCSVTISQSPAAGTVIGPGPVTVTITAENSTGQATCTANVVVVDATPPVITSCPAGTSVSITSGCQAPLPAVTGSVVAADNCTLAGSLTVTQSPAAGTMVGVGTTTITITVRDGANNSATCTTTFTVNGPQVTGIGPARVWVGLKSSDDVGTKFDLLAQVFKNDTLLGSGQANDVPGGSSGFNNAVLETINLALSSPTGICTGDRLSFKLSVRIAATSGHNNGMARLWFNDAAANSRFSATVGGVPTEYFLLDGFVLTTAAGPGPKKTIDVHVNRHVDGNAFKPFGTWTKTF